MAKEKELMLTKEQIKAAIKESEHVKKEYPAFWKFYEMLLEMNHGLVHLQESMEQEKGKRK
jgi:neutral trehalase